MVIRRSTATVLMGLAIAFLTFVSVSAAPVAVADNDIKTLSKGFKDLRQVEGFWDGDDEEYNEDVDAPEGKKHRDMQTLHNALSKPGTAASLVKDTMRPSDDIPDDILKQLKASEPKTTPPTNYSYLSYQWRGNHDFLWFRIDLDTNEVVE
ncbi:hypothetical protein BGZ70_000115, partial [Mortierella alpina]